MSYDETGEENSARLVRLSGTTVSGVAGRFGMISKTEVTPVGAKESYSLSRYVAYFSFY